MEFNHEEMSDDLDFFITAMPPSRPADYYLGCLDGSIFMDFNKDENECIYLKRISFDGYGCCSLSDQVIPMDGVDSQAFKEIFEAQLSDQPRLTSIIKKTIASNRKLIWEGALENYGLV